MYGLISLEQLVKGGYSRETILSEGFPAPIRIGRMLYWPVEDLQAWRSSQARCPKEEVQAALDAMLPAEVDLRPDVLAWIGAHPDAVVNLANIKNGTGGGGKLLAHLRAKNPFIRPAEVAQTLTRLESEGKIGTIVFTIQRHKRHGFALIEHTF